MTNLVRYPYSIPEELNSKKPKYDNKTEIFFVGQLYKDLIEKIKPGNFKYRKIVKKWHHIQKKTDLTLLNQ